MVMFPTADVLTVSLTTVSPKVAAACGRMSTEQIDEMLQVGVGSRPMYLQPSINQG